MTIKNQFNLSFQSLSENVGIARLTATAFAAQVNLTLSDIEEIKVAVSEAVSNAVIHAYDNEQGIIELSMFLHEDKIEYIISDYGRGIVDINLARQPSYSSDPERMGLGFVFMESFMDDLNIESKINVGTTVTMAKTLKSDSAIEH